MEKVILKAEARAATGKKVAKDLRNKGMVPANVYKANKAMSLQLSADDLRDVLSTSAGENVIITLKITGSPDQKDRTVLIKEIQREPIQDKILHVDFNEISLTEMLKVNVPLATKGEPVGVKVDGGVLEHIMWEVQVECLPTNIPEKLELDITNLKIGESMFVKNIAAPEGVKVLTDGELVAVSVKAKKVEAPKEEAAAEAATEPELIRKKKEEEAEEPEAQAKEAPPASAKPEKKE
jgi:large subunit ribosomal protein L25